MDLHEVGFNIENRKLIKVNIEDLNYASDTIDRIMGDQTDYRKKLLSEAKDTGIDME